MDAFYASVEQRDDPALRGRPVIVGGTSTRGVVTAASYEARRFGVRSAMPSVEARGLCPDAVFLPGDMARYRSESRRVFEVFGRFSPSVEGISLDEAFLDLAGTERLLGPPARVAEQLRAEMRRQTGLAVSVGIAPVKMVAKIASGEAKPDGVCIVTAAALRAFLEPLSVGRIWGVGPVAYARLEARGIRTIGELCRSAPAELTRALGPFGLRVAALARGEDLREVEPYRDARSLSEEGTFSADTRDPGQIEAAILAHAEAVARRLRRAEIRVRTITLKLRLGARAPGPGRARYPLRTRSVTLRRATDDGGRIAASACELFARAEVREPIRLVGVSVSQLEPRDPKQLSLLADPRESDRVRRLNLALDRVRDRFGEAAVGRASGRAGRADPVPLSVQIKRGEDERP